MKKIKKKSKEMEEYNSIKSVFPSILDDMILAFGNQIDENFDYIKEMCHDNNKETHFDRIISKFLIHMRMKIPDFNNYILAYVVCILYYNKILNKENFMKAMYLFESDLKYIDKHPGCKSSVYSFRTAGFDIRNGENNFFGSYRLFNFNI